MEAIWCLQCSLDVRRIASGSGDNTIRLWDGESGAAVSEPLKGHTAHISCLAFSPDGHRIASGSWDNTIRLWDAHTGGIVDEPIQLQHPYSLTLYTQNDDLFVVVNHHLVYNLSVSPPSLCHATGLLPASVADSQIQYDAPWTLIRSKLHIQFCLPSNFKAKGYEIHQGKIAYGGEDGSVIIVDCTHLF
jgi:WD40 repeat protein